MRQTHFKVQTDRNRDKKTSENEKRRLPGINKDGNRKKIQSITKQDNSLNNYFKE